MRVRVRPLPIPDAPPIIFPPKTHAYLGLAFAQAGTISRLPLERCNGWRKRIKETDSVKVSLHADAGCCVLGRTDATVSVNPTSVISFWSAWLQCRQATSMPSVAMPPPSAAVTSQTAGTLRWVSGGGCRLFAPFARHPRAAAHGRTGWGMSHLGALMVRDVRTGA